MGLASQLHAPPGGALPPGPLTIAPSAGLVQPLHTASCGTARGCGAHQGPRRGWLGVVASGRENAM